MRSLIIKTATNVIHVVNGKVALVRDNKTGRFVAIKKFANIVNMLVIKAKNVSNAISNNHEFYYNITTKLAMRSFENAAKLAKASLGEVRVYTSRNYCHTDFDFTILSLYA